MKLLKKWVCITLFSVLFVLLLSIGLPVEAQIQTIDVGSSSDLGIAGGGTLLSYMESILNVFLGLVSIIAVALIIYGGLQYITAAGDAEQAKKAKQTIIYAVIGLIVIGLSAVLVNFVLGAFSGRNK